MRDEGHIAKGPNVAGRIEIGTILEEVRDGHELYMHLKNPWDIPEFSTKIS
jgi:hypothetical protein